MLGDWEPQPADACLSAARVCSCASFLTAWRREHSGTERSQPRSDSQAAVDAGHNIDSITICVFGTPSFSMSVLLEGARQCPGKILLCLSSSWFCPHPSSSLPSPLYIRQAVTFDLGGRTFLDVFCPPRRVTYLSWMGGDNVLLGQEWNCPMGGSPQISSFLSNTLEMRLLLDKKDLALPPALVLSPYCSISWKLHEEGKSTSLVHLDGKEGWEERVKRAVSDFLASLRRKEHQQVVIKTCGPQKKHSFPTTFYSVCDTICVAEAVFKLISHLGDKEAILLEGFIKTLPPRKIRPPKPPPVISSCSMRPPELTIRLCAVVCRSRGDQPILSKVVCSVGRAEKPLCHHFALPQSLETTLELWGVNDKNQKDNILTQLKETAENVMKVVMEAENKLSHKEHRGRRAQIDILGVDFLLTVTDYMVTPVILGLTSNHCLESCGVHECMLWNHGAGATITTKSASKPLVETMLQRSLIYVMEKKEVLVIGSGGISKLFIWEAARGYGIKVHLVDSDANSSASSLVASFIHYDYDDQSCDLEMHAQNLVALVKDRALSLSGCITFWNACTILAALVSTHLGLPGPPPSAVRLAKQKTQTQLCLLTKSSSSPPFPFAGAFAVPCCPLGHANEGLIKAEATISYPLVVKPESGSGAVGVRLVQDAEECRRVLRSLTMKLSETQCTHSENNEIQNDIFNLEIKETHKAGIGGVRELEAGGKNFFETSKRANVSNKAYHFENSTGAPSLLLAEYITGSEHDVDLVLSPSGQLLAAYVSDNGPTLLPGFFETAAALPSRLSPEQHSQLVQAAARSCRALGLFPGVFNVELKLTEIGPKLLEINPRMGGFYLRDWILRVYGTDLVLVALALYCGVDPALSATGAQEEMVLVGIMCTGENHEEALHNTANPERLAELHHAGYIRFNKLHGSRNRGLAQAPYCNIACKGKGQREARERLLGICEVLGFDTDEYPVHYLTGQFQ
uniref:ATP-grasp domain-containing protein n=1 Tax=Leptobrachium leishanense TaxID=445787 RepID=A0A8C5Q1X2_9ANUR